MDEKQRIEQLRHELHEHNHRYYVLNQPIINNLSEVFPSVIPRFFVEAFNAIKQEIVGE